MRRLSLRQVLVCAGIAIAFCVSATPSAGQSCYFSLGVYVDAETSGNDIVYWGSGYDGSWCDPPYSYEHYYALDAYVIKQPAGTQVGTAHVGDINIAAELDDLVDSVYAILLFLDVYCTLAQSSAVAGPAEQSTEVPVHAYQQWPTDSCQINQGYSASHRAYDLDATDWNTPVKSMDAGTVTAIKSDGSSGGVANFVVVQGNDNMYTIYAHVTPSVTVNQSVSAGGTIGSVDDTGTTTGPHTHVCRSATQSCSGGIRFQVPSC